MTPPVFDSSEFEDIVSFVKYINEIVFKNKSRKNGVPYVTHPMIVAKRVKKLGVPKNYNVLLEASALAHDTPESSPTLKVYDPNSELALKHNSFNRILEPFKEGRDTCYIVNRLTHKDEEDYQTYQRNIFHIDSGNFTYNVFATLIKLVDNGHNFSDDNLHESLPGALKFNIMRSERAQMCMKMFIPYFEKYILSNEKTHHLYNTDKVESSLEKTIESCIKVIQNTAVLVGKRQGSRLSINENLAAVNLMFPYMGDQPQFGAYRKMSFPPGYKTVMEKVFEKNLIRTP